MKKYEEDIQVRTFQTDRYGYLRPVIMMNFLQSVADTHAESLGAGLTYCNENKIAWVVFNYKIKIENYPKNNKTLKIKTWPAAREKFRAIRDFLITDENDNIMVRATGQWVLIDMNTRRPISLDNLPTTFLDINERAYDTEFEKLQDFDGDIKTEFKIFYDDIDRNQHVNNSVYLSWATESLDFNFRTSHRPAEIAILYKKEIPAGTEKIYIDSKIEKDVSYHKIKTSDDSINSIIKIKWAKNNS